MNRGSLVICPSDYDGLKDCLNRVLHSKKIIIACIGTEIRQDDRAGLEVCKKIKYKDNTVLCEFGLENCLTELRDKNFEYLVIIDGVFIEDIKPGEIIVSKLDKVVEDYMITTHSIPLSASINLLKKLVDFKDTIIIGIRVKNLGYGFEVSEPVKSAIDKLASALNEILGETYQ
ncbi:MAG: hypothetical protein DRO40_04190 [Thermoprotei archaeon]|nr:MAG: hypothetical protein DRO40_04190 [Thermoprotei archaeon]